MITDLQTVKSALQIKDDSKDEAILTWIDIVEKDIRSYCNIHTDDDIPAEYEINAIKMIDYQLNTKSGLASESLSRHSVSYTNGYPSDVLRGLRRRLRW